MRAARLLAGVLLALLGGHAFGQALPPYKMVDSGFPVDVVGKDIHWIDEDRVLFRGVVLGSERGLLVTAHVWDTKENKVAPYGNSQKGLQSFCGNNGYVSYMWQGKLYAGTFGSEAEIALPGVTPTVANPPLPRQRGCRCSTSTDGSTSPVRT